MPAKVYSCLVTGVGGPVGSALVKHLTEAGHHVIAVDSPMAFGSADRAVSERVNRVKSTSSDILKIDVSIPGAVDLAVRDVDFVFAAPWVEGIKTPWKDQYASHVQGTANLIDSLSRLNKKVRRLVLMSSAGIYSPSDLTSSPLTEDAPIAPPTNPLRALWFAEHQVLTRCPDAGITYTIVRPGTIADIDASPALQAVSNLVRSPVVPVPENLTGRVHLANWDDVCGSALHLAKYASGENRIFNVADANPVSAIAIVRIAAEALGHKVVELPSIPIPILRRTMKMGVGLGSLAASYLPIKNPCLDEDAMGLLGTDRVLSITRLDMAGYQVKTMDSKEKLLELFKKN